MACCFFNFPRYPVSTRQVFDFPIFCATYIISGWKSCRSWRTRPMGTWHIPPLAFTAWTTDCLLRSRAWKRAQWSINTIANFDGSLSAKPLAIHALALTVLLGGKFHQLYELVVLHTNWFWYRILINQFSAVSQIFSQHFPPFGDLFAVRWFWIFATRRGLKPKAKPRQWVPSNVPGLGGADEGWVEGLDRFKAGKTERKFANGLMFENVWNWDADFTAQIGTYPTRTVMGDVALWVRTGNDEWIKRGVVNDH